MEKCKWSAPCGRECAQNAVQRRERKLFIERWESVGSTRSLRTSFLGPSDWSIGHIWTMGSRSAYLMMLSLALLAPCASSSSSFHLIRKTLLPCPRSSSWMHPGEFWSFGCIRVPNWCGIWHASLVRSPRTTYPCTDSKRLLTEKG